ncbi:MAG TPA: transposase [Intrasporangium sp.]|uniref:transposase n=1 Tax=Intrasporangium sp. TaxID=1925024 RepID=UPI002F95E6DD
MSQPPAERLPQDSGPSPPARPQRKHYSTEFRTRAVALAARPDLTITAAAADIGVSPSTLRRWVRETEPADPRPVHERIEDEWPDWRSFDWPVLPSPEPGEGDVLSEAEPPAAEPSAPEPSTPEPSTPEPPRAHPPPAQPRAPAPAPARVDDIIFPSTARLGSVQRLGIVAVVFVAAVVLSRLVPEDYRLRPLIVDLHVMSLVASFGAVLLVDWHGLLWLARRRTLMESTRLAAAASPIIWAGLGGLFVTGALLRPDLGSPLTLVKLALVLAVSVNGAVMAPVRLKLTELSADASPVDVPQREWRRMVLATTVSQIAWWGAVVIGFVNSST